MLDLSQTARQVADHIWQSSNSTSLMQTTETWLAENGHDLTSDAVLERFDRLTELVSKNIQSKIQDCNRRGIKPKYQFSSVSPDSIVLQIDTNESILRDETLKAISNLSWRAFEHLCVHIMNATGVNNCEATAGTRDQGIDFIGLLRLDKLVSSSIWHDVQLRVLGQAKNYTAVVGQEKIRLFNEDMRAFSRGEGRAFVSAPSWARHTDMAQIGFVFTLTNFSQGAKEYAASHSIILKDAEQIVHDLLSLNVQTPGLMCYGPQIILNETEFSSHFEQLS